MTSLNGLTLDPSVEESTGEFTVIPAGKYKACLVGDELTDNKAGTGKILKVKVQITDGQFAGEILTDYINITNPNPQAQAIGQGVLKRICNMCGVQYPPQDTAPLMGKPLGIDVKVEKFVSITSGKELKSNKIKAYGPVPTTPPPMQQPAQQQAVQPASGW